jgi:hypothetical protein
MATKITRDVLESYLNCKYKGHLKLVGQVGTKTDYEIWNRATKQSQFRACGRSQPAYQVARLGGQRARRPFSTRAHVCVEQAGESGCGVKSGVRQLRPASACSACRYHRLGHRQMVVQAQVRSQQEDQCRAVKARP